MEKRNAHPAAQAAVLAAANFLVTCPALHLYGRINPAAPSANRLTVPKPGKAGILKAITLASGATLAPTPKVLLIIALI